MSNTNGKHLDIKPIQFSEAITKKLRAQVQQDAAKQSSAVDTVVNTLFLAAVLQENGIDPTDVGVSVRMLAGEPTITITRDGQPLDLMEMGKAADLKIVKISSVERGEVVSFVRIEQTAPKVAPKRESRKWGYEHVADQTVDLINAFVAIWPESEYGPAHVTLSDYNVSDDTLDFSTVETQATIDGQRDYVLHSGAELRATFHFLKMLRNIPEDDR